MGVWEAHGRGIQDKVQGQEMSMGQFVRVAGGGELPPGSPKLVEAGGCSVACSAWRAPTTRSRTAARRSGLTTQASPAARFLGGRVHALVSDQKGPNDLVDPR